MNAAPHPPLDIVIFGGSGDLSWRKLLPSYMADLHGRLPAGLPHRRRRRNDWNREQYVAFVDKMAARACRPAGAARALAELPAAARLRRSMRRRRLLCPAAQDRLPPRTRPGVHLATRTDLFTAASPVTI